MAKEEKQSKQEKQELKDAELEQVTGGVGVGEKEPVEVGECKCCL